MPLALPVLAEASATIHYKLARLQTLTEWWHWLALLGIGGLAAAAQMLLTMAYNRAPAGQTGVYTYLAVAFGAIYGWALWGERPDAWSLLGMGLVIAAAMWASRLPYPISAPPQRELARH